MCLYVLNVFSVLLCDCRRQSVDFSNMRSDIGIDSVPVFCDKRGMHFEWSRQSKEGSGWQIFTFSECFLDMLLYIYLAFRAQFEPSSYKQSVFLVY